jgi:nitrite reductase/ring-hydroxylating ferredoxin subunit
MYSKITKFLFLSSILFLNTFCSKEDRNPIPNVSFEVTIPKTTLVQMGVNSSMIYNGGTPGGVKGIIIYKKGDNEFVAYERLCPNYPNDECSLNIDNSITATCPCCKSKFSLVFGSVMEGVAKHALKEYQTTFNGNYLYIMN